jgi:hypothetical protein
MILRIMTFEKVVRQHQPPTAELSMNTIPKPEESATPERPTVSEIMFSL